MIDIAETNQSAARTRLVGAGLTNEQAKALTDIIWSYNGTGAGGEAPASTMYLEHIAGRVVRSLVFCQAVIAAAVVLAVKFLH